MRLGKFFLAILLAAPAAPALAWGPEGHRIIGQSALRLLDDTARAELVRILGPRDQRELDAALAEACYWPDVVRREDEWSWTAPMHYVNMPRGARHYDRERDCRDGLCVTAAIPKYAAELAGRLDDANRRWQAFAFLCHFVGDLHQPLHAAFGDDRGGNRVIVQFRGESMNLHQFWDRGVVRAYQGENDRWDRPLTGERWSAAGTAWSPREVQAWTDESHALAAAHGYPEDAVVDERFADRSWLTVREQWQAASVRLATVLNAVLGEGEVQLP